MRWLPRPRVGSGKGESRRSGGRQMARGAQTDGRYTVDKHLPYKNFRVVRMNDEHIASTLFVGSELRWSLERRDFDKFG